MLHARYGVAMPAGSVSAQGAGKEEGRMYRAAITNMYDKREVCY